MVAVDITFWFDVEELQKEASAWVHITQNAGDFDVYLWDQRSN